MKTETRIKVDKLLKATVIKEIRKKLKSSNSELKRRCRKKI